nr:hypothetical protein [Tanacetum cinerariifolium]
MSVYDFMTLRSRGDAKIVEEPHHLSEPLLKRVPSHTIMPAVEDALIPLPTSDEVIAAQPDPCLARLSKGPSHVRVQSASVTLEDSMERDEGTSIRVDAVHMPCLGKRLGHPPSVAVASVSGPTYVGTSAHVLPLGVTLLLEVLLLVVLLGNSELRKALDRTISPSEVRRIESLLPLELSNRVNVLSALLVSHGYELNSHYTDLVASKVRLQEKFDRKGDVKLLRSEVTSLDNKLKKVQRDCDALGQENRELRSQRDVVSKEVDAAARGTLSEVTQILPDKLARSANSALIAPSVVNEALD